MRRIGGSVVREAYTVALVLWLLGGAARVALPQSAADVSASVPTRVTATTHFEFHSDPWLNLHHFLYHWARVDAGLATGRLYVRVPERASLPTLSAVEHRAWMDAVDFYRRSVARLSHFDDRMLRQNLALIALGGDLQSDVVDGIPGIADALRAAMPVYQSRWWETHDRGNRGWIDFTAPLVERHEAHFVELTRRVYGAQWGIEPRRVDVSAYANARAGYTAEGHTVIYSTDPGNQELYGVETLFHEVQHTRDVGGAGRLGLSEAFDAAGVDQPRNLWHALIFATAGAFAQTIAQREGRPAHVPYWIREGFEEFRGWAPLVPEVQAYWLPVVRGETAKEAGLAALVGAFEAAANSPR